MRNNDNFVPKVIAAIIIGVILLHLWQLIVAGLAVLGVGWVISEFRKR